MPIQSGIDEGADEPLCPELILVTTTSRSRRSSTTITDQDVRPNSPMRNANSLKPHSTNHPKKSGLTHPHGPFRSPASTSPKSSTLSTVTATSGDYCPRPGCPTRQPGRSTTNPTSAHRRRSKTGSKKAQPSGRRVHDPRHRSDPTGALEVDLCVVSRR